MLKYIIRRLGNTLIVILGVATATFFLARVTGDPIDQLVPLGTPIEAREALRRELGLDAPLATQYVRYLSSLSRLEFGDSLRYGTSALRQYLDRFPATLELVISSTLLGALVGIALGTLAARYQSSFLDRAISVFALFGQAVPGFYLGIMMILVFSVKLGWLPTGGRGTIQQLIMPTIVLSSYYIALITRITRASVLDVAREDYIRTARAKGLSDVKLFRKHVLKGALIPVVTLVGLQVGALFSGAVVAETVFSWPGIGRLALDAVYSRDFPQLQTIVILSAAIFVLVNFFVDLLYLALDPRVSYE